MAWKCYWTFYREIKNKYPDLYILQTSLEKFQELTCQYNKNSYSLQCAYSNPSLPFLNFDNFFFYPFWTQTCRNLKSIKFANFVSTQVRIAGGDNTA